MPICTNANIDASVNEAIDEHINTHVDETKAIASIANANNTKIDKTKCTQVRNRIKPKSDNENDCAKTKLPKAKATFSVNKGKKRSLNKQGRNATELKKPKIKEFESHDKQNLRKQFLYNPDQVVQNTEASHALRQPVLNFVPEGLVSVPTMGPLDTGTSSSAQEIPEGCHLPVLHGQASQEDLMHDTVLRTHELNHSKPELEVKQQTISDTNQHNSFNVSSQSLSPRLPTYDEALTFPSLEEYLRDNPMTDEIRKVLEFQPPISSENTLNGLLEESLPNHFSCPEQNIHKLADNSRDVLKVKLQAKLRTRNDYLPLDLHEVFTIDEGSRVSNQLYSFHSFGNNTPPYTYKQPKQPKPPDKLTCD